MESSEVFHAIFQPSRRGSDNAMETIQMDQLLTHPDGIRVTPIGIDHFLDGRRRTDFALVYSSNKENASGPNDLIRLNFIQNLLTEGLELELHQGENGLTFVKIHCPWAVLSRYGEILRFKMPLKKELFTKPTSSDALNKLFTNAMKSPQTKWSLHRTESSLNNIYNMLKGINIQYEDCNFSVVFTRAKEYLFDIPERKEDFFTLAQRSNIIQFILKRTSFKRSSDQDENDELNIGIEKLLADGIFNASYPLHEGDFKDRSSTRRSLLKNMSSVVYMFESEQWNRSSDERNAIRYYYGEKIGLYFEFMRYYTFMLLPALVVGFLCFVYSVSTVNEDVPSNEICNSTTLMCPRCDENCRYWFLNEACFSSRATYVIDNISTVIYSFFMIVWSSVFLKLWNKYSAKITHRWDITDIDSIDDHSRTQYVERLKDIKKKRFNFTTKMYDPYVPYWQRRCVSVATISVAFMMVLVAVIPIVGVFLFRMWLNYVANQSDNTGTSFERIGISVIAALLNLITIKLFNVFYTWVAKFLTDIEFHRKQTEYDDQLALKLFLLQFVNNFASIFYIAFVKGRFLGHPGDHRLFLGFRQEECGSSGCKMELSIQVFVLMLGTQFSTNIMEALRIMYRKARRRLPCCRRKRADSCCERPKDRCEADYCLPRFGTENLYFEYLTMMLQFSFVTVFAAAFPLAPFFALITNVLQIKFNARKLVCFYRRPVGVRVQTIGIWYRILDYIVKLAALTNGIIFAFTSDFIPNIVYRLAISEDRSINNFSNYSLSYFNTSDFPDHINPLILHDVDTMPSTCRYRDLRYPPWSEEKYTLNDHYWHLLSIRFAFVIIYEIAILLVSHFVVMCIPDERNLKKMIRIENCIVNEVVIDETNKRVQARN